MNDRQRYDYIDTLKGGAIIFVVLYHSQFLSLVYTPNSVRPLLFMIISGMFFKETLTWSEFFKRNIMGLILPYIAYNLLCGVEYNVLHACGVNMPLQDVAATFYASLPHQLPNTPTWFLVTLFITSFLFRCMVSIIDLIIPQHRTIVIAAMALIVGGVGYYIGHCGIHTPLFPEVALTGVVFYTMGYMFSRFPGIEYNKSRDTIGYLFIIPCLMVYLLLRGYVSMAENNYSVPYWQLLMMMASLYVGVFYLCKLIGRVPMVTYLGRYSLIVLCTHLMVIPLLMGACLRFMGHDAAVVVTSITTLVMLRWIVVPLCVKYLPWISGQWRRSSK